MKNLLSKILILSILTISCVFVGCKKDEVTEKNQITFDSGKYNLENGFQSFRSIIKNKLPKSNVYEFDLMLVGSGLTYNADSKAITGQGDYLFLTMFSLDPESIAPGLYTFDRFSSEDSLTFIDGVVGLNSLFSFGSSEDILIITSGVVNITKRGNIYQLDFDLYTEDNEQLVGSYIGILDNCTFDYTEGVGNVDIQGDSPLVHGVLEYNGYSESFETHVFFLYLYGTGITYDESTNELIGNGDFLALAIGSSSSNSLPAGTYLYNVLDFKPFVFTDGILGINNNPSDINVLEGFYLAKNGSFSVLRDRRKYIIDFDLIMDDDSHAKGSYTGFLDFQISSDPFVQNKKSKLKVNVLKNKLKMGFQ